MKAGALELGAILLIVLAMGGCASSAPPMPPSLELPIPVNDLRAVRKGNRVSLAWTLPTQTTDHENIRQYGVTRICRSMEAKITSCATPIATVPAIAQPAKRAAHAPEELAEAYTDDSAVSPGAQPGNEATYAVEVSNPYNRTAGLSNQIHVPVYPALPPPAGFHAEITGDGVRFNWPCSVSLAAFPGVRYHLQVRRSLPESSESAIVADADLADCRTPLFDRTFEWEKTYDYLAAAVIVVAEPGRPELEIASEDTPPEQVVAHDIFPPAVPSGLQAVFSGEEPNRFIDLVWSPDTDADLAGYNVYRREEGSQPYRINSSLIKTPAYRDPRVQPGKKYFYAVSAVDVRGNESGRSDEASETVP